MSLFVDTSVWSLAFRRDAPASAGEVAALVGALESGETILTTGIVLQELLQGFSGPKARDLILSRFADVPLLTPDREDHVGAAELRNRCRRSGVQVGTIDALLARLCLRHDLTMLTTDNDFTHIANHFALRLWKGPVGCRKIGKASLGRANRRLPISPAHISEPFGSPPHLPGLSLAPQRIRSRST